MKPKKLNPKHLWIQFEDVLAPRLGLTVKERAVYCYLLRHSLVVGKLRLQFAVVALARTLGLSFGAARLAVRRLDELGALRVLERNKNRPVYEVESSDVTVADMIRYLRDRFSDAGEDQPVFIMRVFERQRTRRAMIALFLAVLEMVRMQAVVVTQKDLFGEIALQRHKNFEAVFASDQPIAAIEKDYL